MLRHRYPIFPLLHLIGTGLWIALFILLLCALMRRLCRKKIRMFYGHGHCGGHGRGNCGCHGRGHGHCGDHGRSNDHGYCGCHGRGNDHGHFCPTPPLIHLDALEILRRRYASGEIDDTTFQHMRERLGASSGPERPPEG